MNRRSRTAMLAALAMVAATPALASPAASDALPAGGPTLVATTNGALAHGAGGALSRDAADAYIEALQFTLGEIGQPTNFDEAQRALIRDALAAGFPGLPTEVQIDLVNARPLWTQYHAQWPFLPMQSKQEFAYYILALAYGEQAAAQALGLDSGSSGGGGYNPSVDDLLGSVPGTTDCWGSAGCTGYDAGSGTYTFED